MIRFNKPSASQQTLKKAADNCGTGAGGFSEGNVCATGSAAADAPGFERAIKSEETFNEAFKNREQPDEFLGIAVTTETNPFRKTTGWKIEDTEASDFELRNQQLLNDPLSEEESKSLYRYSNGSTYLNEAMRNDTIDSALGNLADPSWANKDNPEYIRATEAAKKVYELANDQVRADAPEGEEFEKAKLAYMKTDEFKQATDEVIALSGRANKYLDELLDIEDAGGSVPSYAVKAINKARVTLASCRRTLRETTSRRELRRAAIDIDVVAGNMTNLVEGTEHIVSSSRIMPDYVENLDKATRRPLISDKGAFAYQTGLDYVPVYRAIPLSKHDAGVHWESGVMAQMLDLDGDGKFTTRSYASTALDVRTALGFGGKGHKVLLKIKATTGAYVEPHTAHDGEKEVLLPRDTDYRITGRQWIKGTRTKDLVLFVEAEEMNK